MYEKQTFIIEDTTNTNIRPNENEKTKCNV